MTTVSASIGRQSHTLRLQRVIRAPRQRVYEAWLKPELRKQWCRPFPDMSCDTCTIDARVGGAYRLNVKGPANPPAREKATEHFAFGEFKELVPHSKIVFTWNWEQPDPMADSSANSLVTVEFRDVPGGTEVTLTHERFTEAESRDGHLIGWSGCIRALDDMMSGHA